MRRSIRVTRQLATSPEAVFGVLTDHARYDRYAGVRRSELIRQGAPAPNGVGALRHVWIGPLRFEEEITAFDAPHSFDYLIRDVRGLPFAHEGGRVRLTATDGGTAAIWTSSFEIPLPLLGPILDRVFARRLEQGFGQVLEQSAEIARSS